MAGRPESGRKVCGKCRARSVESQPRRGRNGATSRGRESQGFHQGTQGPQGPRHVPRRPETKPEWRREDPVPWQLQHMAITCEDAVRRIDELCAVTQHLLKELDVYGWEMDERHERNSAGAVNGYQSYQLKDARAARGFAQAVPVLPQREAELGEPPSTSPCCVPEPHPEVNIGHLHPSLPSLHLSLSSYCPPPLGTRSVMLPCDRCIDLDAFSSQFSPTAANVGQRRRIAEELHSGRLHQRLGAIYTRMAGDETGLTWSRGRLRDFVRCCFTELGVQSPTEPQIYEVYSHFDPELRLGSLTPLESVCLSETLLRATFHAELAESEAVPTLSASAADHPTKLAERWVADYVPLPVDGTVSIAYSTGVVIQFSEFTPLLQPLAVANAEHRERMLKTISSCQLLKNGLQTFQHVDSGFGYLARPNEIMRFVLEIFHQEGYVPASQQHVAPFFKKFAQGKTKLNTSECLCLIDAVCRAILHCGLGGLGHSDRSDGLVTPGTLGTLGTLGTVSTTCSDGQVPPEQRLQTSQGAAKQADFPHQGSLPEVAAMTNEVNELLVAKEVDRGDLPKAYDSEPKALNTARAWLENAKDLPPFDLGALGSLEVELPGGGGPQQFASMALRVYCEHFAGKERLYYRKTHKDGKESGKKSGKESGDGKDDKDSNEVLDFVQAVFLSVTKSSRVVTMAISAVSPVAEHIDLNDLGYLDITQCLLLVDGVLRWILTHRSQDTATTATTSSLPLFGTSIFLQPRGDQVGAAVAGQEEKTGSAPSQAAQAAQAAQVARPVGTTDATIQVFREAFAACDQGNHGYLTWSEVKHFVVMVFRTLGSAPPSESDVYKLYARFDEEHTARLSLAQCIRLADAAVHGLGSPRSA